MSGRKFVLIGLNWLTVGKTSNPLLKLFIGENNLPASGNWFDLKPMKGGGGGGKGGGFSGCGSFSPRFRTLAETAKAIEAHTMNLNCNRTYTYIIHTIYWNFFELFYSQYFYRQIFPEEERPRSLEM